MDTIFPSYELAPDVMNTPLKIYFSTSTPDGFKEVMPHWHRQIEILYWKHGHSDFYCNHNKYSVNDGDIIIVNSNEFHKSENSDIDTKKYAFIISPDYFLAEDNKLNPTFINHIQNNSQCREHLDNIINHYNQKLPFYKTHINGLMFCFLVYLMRNFTTSIEHGKNVETKLSNKDKINQVVLYIGSHFMESLSISQLAKLVYLSDSYLEHLFKEEFSMSITQYINKVRITAAINILGNNNEISIQKLAELVGINDYNYFTRLFKKYTTHTPSFYKKEFKLKNNSNKSQ